MKKNTKLTCRFGSAVTAGLISTALIAAPLTTLVSAVPAIAAEAELPPSDTQTSKSVARTGDGKYFDTLQAALNWADEGEVTLLKDVDETITIESNLKVTLNLGGFKLASNNESAITNEGELTINGGGTVFGVTDAVANEQGGKLTINGGTFEGNVGGNEATGEGDIKIFGGTFSNDVTDYAQGTRSVINVMSGDKTTFAVGAKSDNVGESSVDALVDTAKTDDIIRVTQVGSNDSLTLDIPVTANVTVINNSQGKVKLTGIVLNPGERTEETTVDAVDMYRLYNPYTGEHLYTSSASERDKLVPLGWKSEGIGWTAPSSGEAVYRLYNPYTSDHHYTMSLEEVTNLVSLGWKYEGIGWYSESEAGVPVYRQFNPYAQIGTHNYTTSEKENDDLVSLGWKAEGIAWYGMWTAEK